MVPLPLRSRVSSCSHAPVAPASDRQTRFFHRLLTLALSLDGAGFPRGCEVLAGDVSEPATLAAALERFEAALGGGGGQKPTVILDAGIATEENIGWLRELLLPATAGSA